jgi:hypothetical protein
LAETRDGEDGKGYGLIIGVRGFFGAIRDGVTYSREGNMQGRSVHSRDDNAMNSLITLPTIESALARQSTISIEFFE